MARLEIDDALSEPVLQEGIVRPSGTSASLVERLVWIAVIAVAVAATAIAVRYVGGSPSGSTTPVRFLVSPPPDGLFEPSYLHHAISPDGQRLGFLARAKPGEPVMLWVRSLDAVAPGPLAGTEGANTLFWSPDSQFLAFIAQGKLKKVAVTGGPVQLLCDAPGAGGGTWSQDGTIIFGPVDDRRNLWRVAAAGGTPSAVTTLDTSRGEIAHFLPQFLPDGRQFLYYARPQNDVYLASLDTATPRRLLTADSKALYSELGYLLFVRQGTLLAQAFAADRGELAGEPFVVADQVRFNPANGGGGFSISGNGVLTHRAGAAGQAVQIGWYDRAGKFLGNIGESGSYRQITLSPDGKQLAIETSMNLQATATANDIWLLDVVRGVSTRLTFDPAAEVDPVWSPDAQYIAFAKRRKNVADIFRKSINSGEEVLLVESGEDKYPEDWSANGQLLTYVSPNAGRILGILPLSGDRKPYSFLDTPFVKDEPQFSPDGRWIAYLSNESGRFETYVQSFPGPGPKVRVSTNGGVQPKWRRDGRELFYVGLDGMLMSVEMGQGATLEPSSPRPLFETRINVAPGLDQYAVSLDGQRFLIMAPSGDAVESPPIVVVLNWMASVRP